MFDSPITIENVAVKRTEGASGDIHWLFFENPDASAPTAMWDVVDAFKAESADIKTTTHQLKSNDILPKIAGRRKTAGFKLQTEQPRPCIPILGPTGERILCFKPDASHEEHKFIVEYKRS
jgi:hypothetical protein